MNAKKFYEEWGFWPMSGGVDESPIIVDPPIDEPPPVIDSPPPSVPAIGLDTKLDGDQIPEELRGKSLSEVIGMLKTPPPIPPVQPDTTVVEPPQPQLTQEEQMAELRSRFYQDPVGTVTELVRMAVEPIVNNIYLDKAEKGKNSISSQADYPLLEKDINEFMSNVPVHLRANPKTWDIAYKYAKGKNFDELVKRSAPAPQAPPNLPPPTGGGAGTGVVTSLTPEEKVAAEKMGISEEDYAKWK